MRDSVKLYFSEAAKLLIDCLMKSLTFLMFSVCAVLSAFSTSVCWSISCTSTGLCPKICVSVALSGNILPPVAISCFYRSRVL